jgi:hypothetical protein
MGRRKITDDPLELTFTMDDETRNTVRFEEDADPKQRVMGKIYVTKDHLKGWGDPRELEITVRPKR